MNHNVTAYNRIDLHVNRIDGEDSLAVFGYMDGTGAGPRPIPVDRFDGTVLDHARRLKVSLQEKHPGAQVTLFVDTGGVESVVQPE